MKFKQLKAIIFDLDGTVVDSKLDFDLMREDLSFPKEVPILEHLETIKDEKEIIFCHEVINRHELKGAHESELMPGFLSFFNHLKNKKLPMGILTRNSKKVTQITLDKFNLEFDIVYTRECAAPKPDPEGLLLMAQKWEIDPASIAYVGDFQFDIEVARRAGMVSFLIEWPKNLAYRDEADLCFNDYEKLIDLV